MVLRAVRRVVARSCLTTEIVPGCGSNQSGHGAQYKRQNVLNRVGQSGLHPYCDVGPDDHEAQKTDQPGSDTPAHVFSLMLDWVRFGLWKQWRWLGVPSLEHGEVEGLALIRRAVWSRNILGP